MMYKQCRALGEYVVAIILIFRSLADTIVRMLIIPIT